jgi:hypothetical protein
MAMAIDILLSSFFCYHCGQSFYLASVEGEYCDISLEPRDIPRVAGYPKQQEISNEVKTVARKYCMCPHVSTMDNICDPLLQYMCTTPVEDLRLAYNQPIGCVGVHCNLRVESSSCIVTLMNLGYIFLLTLI